MGELLSLGEEPDRHTGGSARLRGLQEEFDAADANDDNQRARTGDGNADLMEYINKKLEAASCYS